MAQTVLEYISLFQSAQNERALSSMGAAVREENFTDADKSELRRVYSEQLQYLRGERETYEYRATDTSVVYEYSKGWGKQWDGDKASLNGTSVTVVGTSMGDDFGYAEPSVVLLFFLDGDDIADEPWGVMMGQSSPAIRQAVSQAKSGMLPFRAKLEKVSSESHKGQSYWTFTKSDPRQIEAPKK